MNSAIRLTCFSFLITALALACVSGNDAAAQEPGRNDEAKKPASPATHPEYKSALPSQAFLKARGFDSKYRLKEYQYEELSLKEIEISAVRARDGLQLQLVVSVSADVESAKRLMEASTGGGAVELLRGAPSGRKLAEDLRQSNYSNTEPPRGSFRLQARDGRAFVCVRLTYPATRKDERGNWISEVFPRSDLLMAETFVIQTLRELTSLGYTSKSTHAQRAAAKASANAPKPPSK
jgi:hypothetical protein